MKSSIRPDTVVFFDSECVLCGNFLKLVLRIDKKKVLNFASLQSDYSKNTLPPEIIRGSDFKTIAFLEKEKLYFYSDAVIQIFKKIGFPWSMAAIFKILPKKWRDNLYMKVSNNRYSWFGKTQSCIVPDANLRKRFVHQI